MLYQLEGEPERAEEQFQIALRKDPEYSAAHNNYGVFLSSRGRNEEAMAQFEAAARDLNYDRREVALVNLGQAALKLGMIDKAKSSFEHSVRLSPGSVPALVELAEIRCMFLQLGNLVDDRVEGLHNLV